MANTYVHYTQNRLPYLVNATASKQLENARFIDNVTSGVECVDGVTHTNTSRLNAAKERTAKVGVAVELVDDHAEPEGVVWLCVCHAIEKTTAEDAVDHAWVGVSYHKSLSHMRAQTNKLTAQMGQPQAVALAPQLNPATTPYFPFLLFPQAQMLPLRLLPPTLPECASHVLSDVLLL